VDNNQTTNYSVHNVEQNVRFRQTVQTGSRRTSRYDNYILTDNWLVSVSVKCNCKMVRVFIHSFIHSSLIVFFQRQAVGDDSEVSSESRNRKWVTNAQYNCSVCVCMKCKCISVLDLFCSTQSPIARPPKVKITIHLTLW